MGDRDKQVAEIKRKHLMHVYDCYEDDVQNVIGVLLSELDDREKEIAKVIAWHNREVKLWANDRKKLIEGMQYAISQLDPVPLTDARTAMAYTHLKDVLKVIGAP